MEIKQSSLTPLLFLAVDATDLKTPETGLTCTVTISKNGGSFASPAGSVAEVGNGIYKLTPTSADTDTLGSLALHATASGAHVSPMLFEVVANLGSDIIAAIAAGVPLANDAITAAKFDKSTAFPLEQADTGATAVARTGADSDTLETLSDQADAVLATAVAIASSKTRLMVTGNLTSNGSSPVVFPELFYGYLFNEKPYYKGSGSFAASFNAGYWWLDAGLINASWFSTDEVDTPDLVTTWTPTAPATGTPVVTVNLPAVEDKQDTAQADLDILTGTDGATLATAQAFYAPAKAGDAMALTSGERTSMAAAVWNALTSGMTTVGSIGKKLADWVVGTIDTYTGNTKQTANHTASIAAIKAKTDLITAGSITVASPVSLDGTTITARAGDSWGISIAGLGDIQAASKIYFAIKRATSDSDATALVLIDQIAGLTVLNKAAYTTVANGSITVTDAVAGDITIAIDEAATAVLVATSNATWAIKMITSTGTATTLSTGTFKITTSVINATT